MGSGHAAHRRKELTPEKTHLFAPTPYDSSDDPVAALESRKGMSCLPRGAGQDPLIEKECRGKNAARLAA
jgi:hypothetical protein